MITTLVSFSFPSEPDFRVLPFSFSDTEVTVEPISAAAKDHFGPGVASVNFPKSALVDFQRRMVAKGLTVA